MSTRPSLNFSHIGFYVWDRPKMEDFYTRVLGFTVTDRGSLGPVHLTFLSRNPDDHHQIALIDGRPTDQTSSTINQISFKVDSLTTLKQLLVSLKKENAPKMRTITHGNAISIYAFDPEGNQLELFVDTPWYVTQPMRENIDLTASEQEILAAAEKHARAQPGFVPRSVWRAEMVRRMGLA